MNYQQTIDWLFSHLPMFQNNGKKALKNKLDNILFFTEHLGFPHKNFPSIHIAGTNGKGSSSHAIASVLQEAGYKVGGRSRKSHLRSLVNAPVFQQVFCLNLSVE